VLRVDGRPWVKYHLAVIRMFQMVSSVIAGTEKYRWAESERASAPESLRRSDRDSEWMAFFDDPDGHPLAIMTQVGT
jgi:hypothetical protein